MAQVTSLSVLATPGGIHSFAPKAAGGSSPRGADRFTALGVMALPGRVGAFTPKGGAAAGKGAGCFTALSVMGLPGRVQAFAPKTIFVPPVPAPVIQPSPYYKLHGWNRHRLFKYGGRFKPR